jgi:hypothetical protein
MRGDFWVYIRALEFFGHRWHGMGYESIHLTTGSRIDSKRLQRLDLRNVNIVAACFAVHLLGLRADTNGSLAHGAHQGHVDKKRTAQPFHIMHV